MSTDASKTEDLYSEVEAKAKELVDKEAPKAVEDLFKFFIHNPKIYLEFKDLVEGKVFSDQQRASVDSELPRIMEALGVGKQGMPNKEVDYLRLLNVVMTRRAMGDIAALFSGRDVKNKEPDDDFRIASTEFMNLGMKYSHPIIRKAANDIAKMIIDKNPQQFLPKVNTKA